MRLVIVRDGRFTLNNGRPASNVLNYEQFSKRYLEVFDEVVIVGRLFEKEDPKALPIEGPGVRFCPLPGQSGTRGFLRSLPAILKQAWSLSGNRNQVFLLRIPGTIPSIFAQVLKLRDKPFAVELASDPYDAYSKQALDGRWYGTAVQKLFVSRVRHECQQSKAALYVTESALQKRYPPGLPENSLGCTSIDLDSEHFVHEPRTVSSFRTHSRRLLLVGNMQGRQKGHDVLLHAMTLLGSDLSDTELYIIGDGNNMETLQQMTRNLGLGNRVHFLGRFTSGAGILEQIRMADLFVLPSRQEGLPRALIEAMSQAAPAVATNVGGVSELLPRSAIVEPDQPQALADAIAQRLRNPVQLVQESACNLERAKHYSKPIVSAKRRRFLEIAFAEAACR